MTTPSRDAPGNASDSVLLARLADALPPDAILSSPAALAAYECDALTAHRRRPLLALLPDSVAQIKRIVEICRDAGAPIVARGAGTGLSGGARPAANGVLLSLSRMNRILDIDPENRQATVEPGVVNAEVSAAAAPHGLYYAPDPSSQVACTIGGNIAENAGGVHCVKYGLTVHNLQRLRVVTIDGEELELGARAPDSPGFDLLALLTGSEGMLAIVVEATVKLLPLAQAQQVLLAAFAQVEDAARAVAAVVASGVAPAGLEMMDGPAIRAVEAYSQAGYPEDAAAALICETDGAAEDAAEQAEEIAAVLRRHGASEVRVARDAEERRRIWSGRKAAFPAVGRLAPDYYCMDGTIPRRSLAEVLNGIAQLSARHGLQVANVFHAGDGNLHPLIMYDANRPGELETAEAFGRDILELCVKAGGTVTGEHGVGTEKLDPMCSQFSDDELAQFHAVKAAFDPRGLLNPGKAVPTLRRCAELGAMHVRGSRPPHPDLPRF